MNTIPPTETERRKTEIPLEIRSQIIQDWKDGLSLRQSAEKYNVSKGGAAAIVRKYKRSGEIKNLKGAPGRKRTATTPENWRRMVGILESTPNISRLELAKQLNLGAGSVYQMHATFKKNLNIDQVWPSKPAVNPVIRNVEPISESACPDPDWSPSPAPLASVPATTTTYDDWNDDDEDDNISAAGDNQGEVVEAHRCFLCDSLGAQMLDVHFSPESTLDVPVQVLKSLGVICFLGKVLKMRNEDLENVMKEAEGRCPSEWGISVCSNPGCAEAVERAMDLWKEIRKLERKLMARATEIIGRIRRSLKGSKWEMDDQAVLHERVREVLMTSQSKEKGEVMEYPCAPIVKVEPEVEDLNNFDDDFHVSEDLSNDGDEIHLGVEEPGFKVEVDDEELDSRRRSSRMKRKSERFKFDALSSAKKRRRQGKAGPAEMRKVEGKKTKAESKDKSNLGKRKAAAAPVKKTKNTSTKKSDEDNMMYLCQLCPTLERMDMDEFIAHIAFHSRCRNKCNGCNSYFPDSSACSEHPEKCVAESPSGPAKFVVVSPTEAVGRIWDCSRKKCKEKFASGEDRVRHEVEVHGIPVPVGVDFTCSLCPSSNSKFYSLTELRLHKAMEHPQEAVLSCSYCDTHFAIQSEKEGIKFLNLDQLKKHICEEHPEKCKTGVRGINLAQFLQTCPICGLVFSSSNFAKLDNHIAQEHHMNLYEVYTCPICPQTKMRNADVWKHVKKCHWPNAPKPFICQFCGKGFRIYPNWKDHEQIHKNKETRPFQCELCGSSFAVRTYLYIHMRVTHQHRPSPSALRKRKSNDKVLSQPTEASTFN